MAAIVRVAFIALFLQACASRQTQPTEPATADAEQQAPDAGVVADTGAPAQGEAVPSQPAEPRVVIPACGAAAGFTALSDVLARPVPGHISVRARVFAPVVVRCTAGIPGHCVGEMVLAESKPAEPASGQIKLFGTLPDSTPLRCAGRRGSLSCPLPEGAEYGIVGTLSIEGDATENWLTLVAESVCRF